MVARLWMNWNCHILLIQEQNGAVTSGGSVAVSPKVKHTFLMQPSNSTLRWNLNKTKLCSQKNLHRNVYKRFIHTHQNLGNKSNVTDLMNEFKEINKNTVVHPCNGKIKVLIQAAKQINLKCTILDESSQPHKVACYIICFI